MNCEEAGGAALIARHSFSSCAIERVACRCGTTFKRIWVRE